MPHRTNFEFRHAHYISNFQTSLQQNRSQGTVSAYESNVAKNKGDLKQAQYKDIDKRYCGQLVQLKVGIEPHYIQTRIFTPEDFLRYYVSNVI